MQTISLDGKFRPWTYGIGHSQLILYADRPDENGDTVSVHFEAVSAVKLRRSYPGLTIRQADEPARSRILDFADLPDWLRPQEFCLVLPTEADGFVACGRMTIRSGKHHGDGPAWRLPENPTVLHSL